jgi:DNA-binding transcriptional regulator YiaG
LHKRRAVLGLIQAQAAETLGVSTWTYLHWETDRTTPTIRYYPAIFDFLGYGPFLDPTTLSESIAVQRQKIGLSIKQAAELVGLDEGTFSRWERGERQPGPSEKILEGFLGDATNHFAERSTVIKRRPAHLLTTEQFAVFCSRLPAGTWDIGPEPFSVTQGAWRS